MSLLILIERKMNLREYFYPFIDSHGCRVTYEFNKVGSDQPYRKSIIEPGISIPNYPKYPGAVYFTRTDMYWNGKAFDDPNWWYMRQRDDSIIEEVADTAYGHTVQYWDKVITHAYGLGQALNEPIRVWCNGCEHPYGKLWSYCKFVKYYPVLFGFSDVVEMDFAHGSYWGTAGKACLEQSYPHRPPYTSYWQKIWFAKGIGQLYSTILWDERSCAPAWSYYLSTCYG